MLPSFDDQFAAIENKGTSLRDVAVFAQKDTGVMCKTGKMISISTKTMHDPENDKRVNINLLLYVCRLC